MSAPLVVTWLAGTLLPLGALWTLFRAALRSERCFGYNRGLLLLAPLVAAALPLLPRPAALAGFWNWDASAAAGGATFSVVLPTLEAAGRAGPDSWPGWPWLLGMYAVGVALGLGRLAYQLRQLRRTARQLPRELRPGYVLVRTGGRLPTSSFGKTVFWDETAALTAAEAAQVLAHELAHVRQGHSSDVLWLEIWRAVLWVNPFAHLLLPALRLTHELLADRAVAEAAQTPVAPTAPALPYAALLARLTTERLLKPAFSPLLQPFTFSFTLTRLAMLQSQNPVRRWKQWLALPVLAGLFTLVGRPASAQTGAPAPPPPPKPMEEIKTVDLEPNKPKLYTYVEQMPELPGGGGNAAIVQAIQQNLVYPKLDAGGVPSDGKIFVQFTVDAVGAVRDTKIIRGLAPAYDAAVLAAVQKLPRFTPGRQSGKPVAVSFTVPILFVAK